MKLLYIDYFSQKQQGKVNAGKGLSGACISSLQREQGLIVSLTLWCIPTQANVSPQAWLIPSAVTNCCHPNSSWKPFNFPFHLVSLTLATYGYFGAMEKPRAWALQTWMSIVNFQHLTDVRKNCLHTWTLNAWELLCFPGHSLQQQYKGSLLRASNLHWTNREAQ